MPRRLFALLAFLAALAGCAAKAAPATGAPSEYRLDLSVSDDLSRIDGALELRYANQGVTALDALQLFLFPNLTPGSMKIESCSVDGRQASGVPSMNGAKIRVGLAQPLAPGAAVRISLRYRVEIPQDPKGVYGGFSRTDSTLAMAWCYPVVLSPAAWGNAEPVPYADYLVKEPSTYQVSLSFPDRFSLAAPGVEERRRSQAGRTEISLRCFAARDLFMALGSGWAFSTARAGDTLVRSFAPAGRQEAAAFSADAAAHALEIFERRFGSYPFATLTLAAVPLASYGLEFPGIVAISDRIYDLDSEVNEIPTRALLESTVVHETAHQWFYGLVGNDQVREPWVDEATAQYATWLYFRDRYGTARAGTYFASFQQRWQRVGREAIPIGLGVADYSEKAYGAIVYGRGPLFLRALSDLIGEPVFDSFLREWVQRYSAAIATGRDFERLASEISRRDLAGIFSQWVWPARN
jgi:hypothetical protein